DAASRTGSSNADNFYSSATATKNQAAARNEAWPYGEGQATLTPLYSSRPGNDSLINRTHRHSIIPLDRVVFYSLNRNATRLAKLEHSNRRFSNTMYLAIKLAQSSIL
ncbi:MAG: hypothetical protein Q9214_002739, partial [Letrouitia sp. 1 TL-2023]